MTGKADAVRAVSEQFKDRTNTVIEGVMAHLRDDNAKEILGPGLSPLIGRGSLKSIVTFALYADVLRMVRDVVMADGQISDEEVQESLGLLSVLAAGFAKVRKEYKAYASLSHNDARDFLAFYSADKGLFGHASEATKWAGVELCRNIQSRCGQSGPLEAFGGSLVAWGEAIAGADEATSSEKALLEEINARIGTREIASKPALTKEIAQQFLADEQAVDLNSFTAIDDAAAETLATYADHCLRKVLTETATRLDARASEEDLDASGMCDLAFCEEFAELQRSLPFIDGFRHPRRGLANGFCCAYGFDAKTAKALSAGAVHPIQASMAYFFIDDAYASGLADEDFQRIRALWMRVELHGEWDDGPMKGWIVEASNLAASAGVLASMPLNDEALEAYELLADDMDMLISLEGITSLSAAAARSLSRLCCDLVLGALSNLDSDTAGLLAEHPCGSLSLGSLACSEATALALSKHRGPLVLELHECPVNIAAALSRHSGRLVLRGFESLDAAAARALAQHRGDLVLDVTQLSDAAAECLSAHEGRLSLPWLETLTEGSAKSLSGHRGELELGDYLGVGRDDSLTEMPDKAVAWLARHRALSTNPELEARLKTARKNSKRVSDPRPVEDEMKSQSDAIDADMEDYARWRSKGCDSSDWLRNKAERYAEWLRTANLEDPRGQFFTALCYDFGCGVDEDKTEAVRLYRAAADKGIAFAMLNLGLCYLHGEGVDQAGAEAIRWLLAAADKGDADALHALGVCYDLGESLCEDIAEDKPEAVRCYLAAASKGNADAMNALGTHYRWGDGVSEDKTEAVRWFRAAAAEDHPRALFNLGDCYATGDGVEQNRDEAIRYFCEARDLGDEDAGVRLQTLRTDS